ncbi:hypothetical protein JXO59_09860 [candidate division KSB1 bacterium]|nr:hypothetical protein [candidate division KSB1 bacterium]
MPRIISISRWRPVYALAQEISELAPWEFMEEIDIFAVQDPESGRTGYVSVMGAVGEHFAVAIYLDQLGLDGFLHIQSFMDKPRSIDVLIVPQLQLSFEEKTYLESEDRQILKELDIKPRGNNNWPMFRSYKPGYAPWFMENDEIDFMKVMLEQVVAVLRDAEKVDSIRDLLRTERMLTRVGKKAKYDVTWEDQILPIPPPQQQVVQCMVPAELVEQVVALPQVNKEMYLDLDIVLRPVLEKNITRPYFPFILLFMDKKSELIAHNELIPASQGWQTLLEKLPIHIMQGFDAIGFLPKTILMRSERLFNIMQSLSKAIPVKIKMIDKIPAIEEFLQGFYDHDLDDN